MAEFGNGYILGFATVVCVVSSLALAGTHSALKPMQDTNIRRDFQKDVLAAVGLPEDGKPLTGPDIDKLYAERVKIVIIDKAGKIQEGKTIDDANAARTAVKGTTKPPELLAVYERIDDGKVGALALPLYGRGLWGPISGFVALAPDGKSVTGSVFFAPSETPGLGYEITSSAFEDQWKGKSLADASGDSRPVKVVKGKASELCADDPTHCVDGITGATLTCRGVNEMMGQAVTYYDPYLRELRANGG